MSRGNNNDTKKYTQEFKDSIIKAAIETGNIALVARQNGLSKELVYKWVRQNRESNREPKANIKKSLDNSNVKNLEA
ncbi:transposase [Caloramator sp. Dgby_cultured_2]|uniref:transposase n=1 Tax=Caloramator sp. Dgby_cultured_2 TaxID=3029174 RepID=UPI00237EDD6B|nr:transposase [Caloramator sp. Dgby_cultured_2]WDU83692.1 transposase [Caloramator sp. Dgby_cultured_2]